MTKINTGGPMTETPQELIARLMQHVEDTMDDASVDYPAGYRAGARILYDSDSLQTCFETELIAAPDLHSIVTEQQAEIERLRAAMEDTTCVGFDCPMTWGGTDEEWERRRANIMQQFARKALEAKP
jgi:hypothetical protein